MKCSIAVACALLSSTALSARAAGPVPVEPSSIVVPDRLPRAIEVDCNRGETIGWVVSRLAALGPRPLVPSLIRVSGACHENVVIEGFDELTIAGRPGATLTATSSASDSAAIKVVSSRQVTIQDLDIDAAGAFAGILIRRCQDCSVARTAISNGGVSVYVEQPGFTALSEVSATGPAFGGIWALDNAAVQLAGAHLEGTSGPFMGLWAYNSASLTFVGATVRGFFSGVGADSGASLQGAGLPDYAGDRTIRLESNRYTGVWATGRSRIALGGSGPAGAPVVIADNTTMGVTAMDASVTLSGDVRISNHAVAALYAAQQAQITISNAELSAAGIGLWVSLLSLVGVNGPVTLSGTATDVQCDASSVVSGAAGISGTDPSRIHCNNLQ